MSTYIVTADHVPRRKHQRPRFWRWQSSLGVERRHGRRFRRNEWIRRHLYDVARDGSSQWWHRWFDVGHHRLVPLRSFPLVTRLKQEFVWLQEGIVAEWTTWAVAGHLDRPELLTVGRHLPPVAVECVPTCPSRHRGQAVPAGRVRELSRRKSARYCSNHWLWATTSRRRRRATCRLGSGRLALIWRAPVPPSSSAPSTCTTTPSSRIPTTFSFSSNSSKSTILPKSIRWILKSPRMSWGNVIFLLHSVENCNDLICWWRRQVRDGGLQRLVLAVAGSQVARSPFLPPDSHPALGAALPRVGCFSLMNERAPPLLPTVSS